MSDPSPSQAIFTVLIVSTLIFVFFRFCVGDDTFAGDVRRFAAGSHRPPSLAASLFISRRPARPTPIPLERTCLSCQTERQIRSTLMDLICHAEFAILPFVSLFVCPHTKAIITPKGFSELRVPLGSISAGVKQDINLTNVSHPSAEQFLVSSTAHSSGNSSVQSKGTALFITVTTAASGRTDKKKSNIRERASTESNWVIPGQVGVCHHSAGASSSRSTYLDVPSGQSNAIAY
ncbi:hypothetical protein RUM43_006383 [Polyplax serrata]|uniref:Uncharacterized protein n=1 Tax=Polyplax serrata TaxID=468196 RepID=A0AAN8S920_POLSC